MTTVEKLILTFTTAVCFGVMLNLFVQLYGVM